MVGFGATKYFKASQKADRNSISSSDLAAVVNRSTLKLATSDSMLPELQHRRHDDDHGKRERQENLPAEPHQLVVAVARHHGLDHGEQEEQEANFQREPYHARIPGEWRNGTGGSQPPRNRIVPSPHIRTTATYSPSMKSI